jgi:hypothetical protein
MFQYRVADYFDMVVEGVKESWTPMPSMVLFDDLGFVHHG